MPQLRNDQWSYFTMLPSLFSRGLEIPGPVSLRDPLPLSELAEYSCQVALTIRS
jgi:hypothetical protein